MADVIAVAALNKYVKSLLESDPVLANLAVRGEISNFNKHYKTGHCYFSIKDDKASISAVMFRSDAERLAFQPENGMAVVARCRVSLYERDGRYQLYVQELFPDGVGAAQMAFEQLKVRLQSEGLFEQMHKKPLPGFPKRIGLVTSKTGAALQDILKVASHRCPDIHFLLAPVTVQGAAAAPEIAAAIQTLDNSGQCDVIIVARGGGSAEDLWVFNAEAIARAAFASKTPLVSAIGHEIDFTILDFVADLRAPTPSAAAELALPDLRHAYGQLLHLYANIQNNIHSRVETWYTILEELPHHPALQKVAGMPVETTARLDGLQSGIDAAMQRKLHGAQQRFSAAADLAGSLNPYAVFGRGYSMASQNGAPVKTVQSLAVGDTIDITLADGTLGCLVQTIQHKEEIKP